MNQTQKDLLRLTGNIEQVAYVREVVFTEGRARGMRAYEVNNGPLFFRVLEDKAMDMEELSFKGLGMNFLSRPGLQAPGASDTSAWDAVRSIMGGFFFTAGLRNIGPACEVGSEQFTMHGRMRATPAEHTSSFAHWEDDRYILGVSGEMREASLFGENLTLQRTITTEYGQASFEISDVIENQNCRDEPLMMLYHFNLGYPFLRPGSELISPTLSVHGREEFSQGHMEDWRIMGSPSDGEGEFVFIHDLAADEQGQTAVAMDNHDGTGVLLEFSKERLPYFMQWQCIASGDYVTGLEPATASVYGRAHDARHGHAVVIAPFEKYETKVRVTILSGDQEIHEARERITALI